MDIAGRRKLLLGPMVGMIITLIVIVIAINLQVSLNVKGVYSCIKKKTVTE